MKYYNTSEGTFLERPNRFIAKVEIDGKIHLCHVKNTGRCKELLTPYARVILEKSQNPTRKTHYDLISVYKGDKLINIDSQAPNRVFGEWLKKGEFFKNVELIKPECQYKDSRYDFFLVNGGRETFVEIKGVTLEENGVVRFPDAPTERGVKHIKGLIDALKEGFDAYVFFVIQMENCKYFTPNAQTHPEFAQVLKEAKLKGVKVYALNCIVGESELEIKDFVKVKL